MAAGDRVAVTDASGTVVASWVAVGTAASVVVVAGGLTSGEEYTVWSGPATGSSATGTDGLSQGASVTATDVSAVSTHMGGGPGGGGRGPGAPNGGPGAPPAAPDQTTT